MKRSVLEWLAFLALVFVVVFFTMLAVMASIGTTLPESDVAFIAFWISVILMITI